VGFLEGFGARGAFSYPGLRESLGDRFSMESIASAPDSTPPLDPDSLAVLVVAGPTQRFDSLALERIDGYLQAGGSALLLLEPIELNPQNPTPIPVFSGLESLLEERGILFNSSLVVDLASSEQVSLGQRGFFNVIAPYPLWPIVGPSGDHVLTRGLNALTLGWAGALSVTDSADVVPLWQTTEAGGVRGPGLPILPDQPWDLPEEELGVRVVAVAYDPAAAPDGENDESGATVGGEGGRMVVVGDASFLETQFAQANPQNVTFVANSIDWLAKDEALIRIRSKNRTPPGLAFTSDWSRSAMKWGNLLGVPLLYVLLGIYRVAGRRRRAEARWKEVLS
jgi:ABC-type uncharacterized transport system involved in gliding motility auxiliary subunit